MSELTCSACGASTPIKSLYDLNGKAHCAACAQHALEVAKSSGQPTNVSALANKLLCARCNTYLSEGAQSLQSGNLRFCEPCGAMVKDWQYPQWLRLSFAGLLLLLVVALAHGTKYFSAGKSLYIGERLLEEKKYSEALPYLQKTLSVAPNSDKAALLGAKTAILSGRPDIASQALQGHNNGYFEDASDSRFQEVNALWNRTSKALDEIDQANKLEEQEGKEAEAAKLMHAAASDYPQLPDIALALNSSDGGVAFANKDYDQFLELAEKNWTLAQSWSTALSVVSALDCKYATTGDTQYRTRSEELFEKARAMASGDQEALAAFNEFADRHKFRLETRKIISRQEFDRRFRTNKTDQKK